ncbi:SAM-dependent methyltransferase [Actinospica sp.]|uniref:SAM-dependent methyltransferase n=1 Tax=Actinospica sp. TaxID=1872142 RepID=UPI002B770378|nr:SAM-dependent methyltransferase [Actinospica sp.]HWG27830.1 SAM-dependent methyltransferase [Actinospica sp.]
MTQYRPVWAPDGVEIEKPSTARMYDFYLGGSHNFAADRQLAARTIEAWPDVPHLCQANRAFLRRSVTHLASLGVDQFLDLGSGIPTAGNVHEVVHAINPDARVVYVDADPVAIAHSKALLAQVPEAAAVYADLRDPDAVLDSPEVAGFLDLARPVALLMFAALPFVPDSDDPAGIVAAYRDKTAPGSYLALSHGTGDYRPEAVRRVEDVYTQASHAMRLRSRDDISALMDGYELLDPGLVDIILWRPDPQSPPDPLGGDVTRYSMFAAVGRR